MEKKLLKIINHYGVLPQLKYFQSEVFELSEAIINVENEYNMLKDIGHIAEEIADVLVMLNQFKNYYNIPGEVINEIFERKVDRQIQRIEKE